jgi:hypothetical protein
MASGQPAEKPAAAAGVHASAPVNGRNRTPAWWKKLLLLAGSLVVGLVVIELGARLFGLDVPLVWEPDPELGWRNIPGARRHFTEEGDGWIEINRLGLRDRERALDRPAGVFRIGVFGDSMTQGVQVHQAQTFCAVLEENLTRRGFPVEVLNFGVNGHSPVNELLLFRREGPKFNLDLVILALFLDNDVAGCHPDLNTLPTAPHAYLDGNGLRFDFSRCEQSYADYHREPVHTIRKWSALYRIVGHWRRLRAGQAYAAEPLHTIPTRFRLYLEEAPPWGEAWAVLERVVLEFAAEARRQKTDLVVLSVPAGQTATPQAWQNLLDRHPVMKDRNWDLEKPDRRLAAFAREHDLRLLQPIKMFQQTEPEPPLFFGNVGHLTERGHRLLAEQIENYLLQQGVLPPSRPAAVQDR